MVVVHIQEVVAQYLDQMVVELDMVGWTHWQQTLLHDQAKNEKKYIDNVLHRDMIDESVNILDVLCFV